MNEDIGTPGMLASLNAAQQRIYGAALRLFAERGITQLAISELAQAAGVARGTIYNNVSSPENLFESVAAQLSIEMNHRIRSSSLDTHDRAQRLANGMRFYMRRAYEEPHWGRFITRFAMSTDSLQGMWKGPVVEDLLDGLTQGRYNFRPKQVPSVVTFLAGTVLSAMHLVLDGHRTWREAGENVAELTLIALGIPAEEARTIATVELPSLVPYLPEV